MSKVKENKIQRILTTGLRRSTRLNTVKEEASKPTEHIDLESKEKYKCLEDSPRVSLRLSPRVSPLPFISLLTSPVQCRDIDPVQQEIYDCIESLERKEATTKGSI